MIFSFIMRFFDVFILNHFLGLFPNRRRPGSTHRYCIFFLSPFYVYQEDYHSSFVVDGGRVPVPSGTQNKNYNDEVVVKIILCLGG